MIRCLPFAPVPDDQVIWHYTDFSKFFGILQSRQLHFSTTLELRKKEPYELRTPSAQLASIVAETARELDAIGDLEPEVRERTLAYVAADTRGLHHYGVSCWHRNEGESYAMWKAFTNGVDGVAIKTTVGRLKRALQVGQERIFHDGNVSYIDYAKDDFQPNDHSVGLEHLFHKARFYEHEREYRLAIWLTLPVGETFSSVEDMVAHPTTDGSRKVSIDIAQLVEGVVVCPYAAPWFKPTIEEYLTAEYPEIKVTSSAVATYPSTS